MKRQFPFTSRFFTASALTGLFLFGAGCVSAGTFDAKVSEMESIREQHDRDAAAREKTLEATNKDLAAQIARLEGEHAELQARLQEATDFTARTTAERDALKKQMDGNTALVGELKSRLAKLGVNIEDALAERGKLADSLAEAEHQLGDLRRQKEAADRMAASFKELVQKFRSMIDAGTLKVVIRDGRMQIVLPSDILFDSARTEIKSGARVSLQEVARILATVRGRNFVVAGHTDNVPIHNARFASNWELSTARAVEVTRFLVASGMQPQVFAAAGYGEFDPVSPNDTLEHRATNRRVEIVLQPNLAELPMLSPIASAH